MKKALVTGASGQDGIYLCQLLLDKGYEVVGVDMRKPDLSHSCFSVRLHVDLASPTQMGPFLDEVQPDEIYHLAACHFAADSLPATDFEIFKQSNDVHVVATAIFLDWIKERSPRTRLFFAASCHVFGKTDERFLSEASTIKPNCIYGMTKYAGMQLCKYYREKYQVFAAVGILFNHESPRRADGFVTQKIVKAAVAIKHKKLDSLTLGNLAAVVDWGYAPEYVEAMHKMLQHTVADDFVIATGAPHTIGEFAQLAFGQLGLDWRDVVREDGSLIKKKDKSAYVGNPAKIARELGWQPRMRFDNLVRAMVNAELERYEQK